MKISYLGNLTSTFLLLASFFCVQSAPARPLNERSTEFAWVILDEQQSDSSPRRKITPKSIFISPSFGAAPQTTCNPGYTLDASGRCVKLVEFDKTAHEQFVLELLSQNFGEESYEDYDDEGEVGSSEALPTPGPFQFNIPLGMESSKDKISIIVAPTNGHFEDAMKFEDKKASQVDAPLIVANIDVKDDPVEHKPSETTTPAPTTTTPTAKTTIHDAEADDAAASTISTREDLTTITTEPVGATTVVDDGEEGPLAVAQEQQAIFFKLPDAPSAAAEDVTQAQSTHLQSLPPATTPNSTVRYADRAVFDEALFQDFLQDMKKQVNRRFVTKATAAATDSEDALYSNHRNRDRWLFPRFLEERRRARR